MNELRRLIDNPPAHVQYSQVSLLGDQLMIKTQVRRRYPVAVLLITGLFFGAMWGLGWLFSGPFNCCLLGFGVYGFIVFRQLVGSKKRLGVGAQTLRISPEGIELSHSIYAVDADTPAQQSLALKDVQTYYLDSTLKQFLSQRLNTISAQARTERDKYTHPAPQPVPNISKSELKRPGIYFVATDGTSYAFDTKGLITGGSSRVPDLQSSFVESEWLFAVVSSFLQELGVDSAAARQVQHRALLDTLRKRQLTAGAQGDLLSADSHSTLDMDLDFARPETPSTVDTPPPIDDTEGW